MSAACVPWYVPCGNTGLSQHGNSVFPPFAPFAGTHEPEPGPCEDKAWGGG